MIWRDDLRPLMIEEDAMKQHYPVFPLLGAIVLLFASMPSAIAQAAPDQAGVPVSMVVTVKARRGAEISSIRGDSVIVNESRTRARVTNWVPLQGDRAGLELFILLDDSRDTSLGTQLEDIRNFMRAQPATTKIGVAYMQDGGLKIVQNLTADHALAAGALHATLSNFARSASPYDSLSELIKQWPASDDRREILMVSSGADEVNGDHGPDRDDGSVDAAIDKAQRAGIVVFAIGTSGEELDTSHVGRSKYYLSRLAEETGGESYYRISGPLTSFVPYLDDITERLSRQYLLAFVAKAQRNAGMQSVKVRTDASHMEIASAERVFVPVR
jgi:hypothetical protein